MIDIEVLKSNFEVTFLESSECGVQSRITPASTGLSTLLKSAGLYSINHHFTINKYISKQIYQLNHYPKSKHPSIYVLLGFGKFSGSQLWNIFLWQPLKLHNLIREIFFMFYLISWVRFLSLSAPAELVDPPQFGCEALPPPAFTSLEIRGLNAPFFSAFPLPVLFWLCILHCFCVATRCFVLASDDPVEFEPP